MKKINAWQRGSVQSRQSRRQHAIVAIQIKRNNNLSDLDAARRTRHLVRPLQHRLQSTRVCITEIYTFSSPPSFYSISTTFVPFVYSFGILGHALSRGGQDISLKVYRVFFVNETEEQSEKFRRNKSSYGAIYLQTLLLPPLPPFFLPPPPRYSFWNISQSPLSFSLSLSRPPQTLVSTPFFFFVSFFRHRLSVTHCPSAATMCSVLQNCTRYVKRKNFGVQTRNTLVAVLKRIFPRFRPLLPVL